MHTHKVKVTIPGDHHLSLKLPDNFPTGPAEVIVHSEAPSELPIIKLAGVLAPSVPAAATADDPIANALEELRQERRRRGDKIIKDVEGREDP